MLELIQSPWVSVLCTLIINMGSSYVMGDVNNIFQGVFAYKFMKWLVLFAICFASTKDVYVSICVSLFVVFTVWHLCNDESEWSLPKIRKDLRERFEIDIDNN
jgi:hypothetical protein|tara:strand:- start:404 stop:712 length:309 start_codon:yes stop_codon:yes gene_type:complete